MNNLIGINIENYKIVSLLGKGGMGIVYKAYDTKLDRYVAIKMLSPQNNDNERFTERFKREAKNQAKLMHPNIATVYGFIEYESLLGIVMEYIDGDSLEKIIYKRKRISLVDSLYIIQQVLKGLGFAHSKGFIHRDIKPSNIIFNKDGVVKIMDFGISKSLHDKGMTKTGAKVGTLYYMSPEQVRGGDLTIQSDIYSVGCTLYEMLVGEPPYYNQTDFEVMEGHLKKEQQKISKLIIGMPEEVDKIIAIAMKKIPEERFASCEEFFVSLSQLDKIIQSIQAKAPTFENKNQNKTKVKIYSIAGFSAFILIVLGLSYFIYSQVHELLASNKLEELKKYSIQSLFDDKKDFDFSKIQKLSTNINYTLNSAFFIDELKGFAIGDSGSFLVTNDEGNTWSSKKIDSSNSFNDCYFFKSGKSFLVGNKPEILISNDFFDTFTKFTFNDNFSLLRIVFFNNKNGFALGSKGTLLKTQDGGTSWTKISLSTNETLYDIEFTDKENGFIVGWQGILLRTTNGGANWETEKPFTNKYLKSLSFSSDDIGIAVGGSGDIFRTDDDGTNWKEVKTNHIGSFQKIKFLSEDIVLGVGSKGTIIFSNDAGETWKLIETGVFVNFTNFCSTPKGHLYIVGINGTLLKLI